MLSCNFATARQEKGGDFRRPTKYKFIAPVILSVGMLLVIMAK